MNEFRNEIDEILEYEGKTQRLLEKLKTSLYSKISNSAAEGVTMIPGKVKCCTVNISTVMKNNSILSAEYYIPQSQADAVLRKLNSCEQRMSQILDNLQKMCDEKKVRIGEEVHMLNPATVAVLSKILDEDSNAV